MFKTRWEFRSAIVTLDDLREFSCLFQENFGTSSAEFDVRFRDYEASNLDFQGMHKILPSKKMKEIHLSIYSSNYFDRSGEDAKRISVHAYFERHQIRVNASADERQVLDQIGATLQKFFEKRRSIIVLLAHSETIDYVNFPAIIAGLLLLTIIAGIAGEDFSKVGEAYKPVLEISTASTLIFTALAILIGVVRIALKASVSVIKSAELWWFSQIAHALWQMIVAGSVIFTFWQAISYIFGLRMEP